MSFARIKETFLRFPSYRKLIALGALVLAVSVFLPWYADLDSYNVGDQFLGVTGPASFVGIVIFVLAGLSLWIFSYHLLGRRMAKLPVREGIIHIFTGAQSLFLLLLVNSIYFHIRFGVNITLKESRFGMIIAIVSSLALLIGAYLQNKQETALRDDMGKLEPLIKVQERPHAGVAEKLEQEQKQPQIQQQRRSFLYGEPHTQSSPQSPAGDKKEGGSGSYMIRMDL